MISLLCDLALLGNLLCGLEWFRRLNHLLEGDREDRHSNLDRGSRREAFGSCSTLTLGSLEPVLPSMPSKAKRATGHHLSMTATSMTAAVSTVSMMVSPTITHVSTSILRE